MDNDSYDKDDGVRMTVMMVIRKKRRRMVVIRTMRTMWIIKTTLIQ